jgi:PAS domain S-box-containing protein
MAASAAIKVFMVWFLPQPQAVAILPTLVAGLLWHGVTISLLSSGMAKTGNTVETHHMTAPAEFSELAFEYAPIGLVVTENRVIRTCNPAFAAMFGYEREALIDQSFALLYPSQEEFVRIRNVGVEPLRRDNRYSDERIMARAGGGLFWCRVRGHSLTRDDDPLRRAVWSFADLSEIRQVASLSARERQIVMHLGEGRTSKEIARRLEISPRTVESYRARLLRKYNAHNVAELLSHLSSMPG